MLKALGKNRALVSVTRFRSDSKPWKITGFRLEFQGGVKPILLGKEKKEGTTLTLTDATSIEIGKSGTDSDTSS